MDRHQAGGPGGSPGPAAGPGAVTPADRALEAFQSALLSGLRARVGADVPVPWDEVERQARGEAEALRARGVQPPGAAGMAWLARAGVVLAAYRALTALGLPGPRVVDDVQAVLVAQFEQNMDPYLAERFGIDRDRPAEAFARVSENFLVRGQARFGAAFEYVPDVQDATRSFTNIRRCGFNDFFRANRAPEVTRVFCALDIAWADEMERRRLGVRFERPTTLARGDDACRFQFTRVPRVEEGVSGPGRS